MRQYIYTLIIIIILQSCDRYPAGCDKSSHRFITFKNKMEYEIYYTNQLRSDFNLTQFSSKTKIKIKSDSKFYLIQNLCWEENFLSIPSVNFYFYDAEILENNKWSDVVKNNLGILDSVKVDLAYMQKNNWTVTYPK
jgi:hypothetical protein